MILDVRCFSSIFAFFEHSTLLAIPMHLMFLLNFSVFSSLLLERYRVTNFRRKTKFFTFSRTRIHARLTKNHECFRFSRHLPPVSKQYQNSYLYLMPLPSARENHQEAQNFHFLEILHFFDHSGQHQRQQSVFHFTIFQEFGSLIQKIWGNPWPLSSHYLQHIISRSLFTFRMVTEPEQNGKEDQPGTRQAFVGFRGARGRCVFNTSLGIPFMVTTACDRERLQVCQALK